MSDRPKTSEYDPSPPGRRDKSHPLRNVYQTGDEMGDEPADNGETFRGLARRKETDHDDR